MANDKRFITKNGLDVNSNTIINVATPSNSSDAATKNYVDTEISNLVASSPAALDTLNELAAALGDDPNFATTVSTQIGTKLNANHDMTLTLSGDVSGSTTFTDMGNATLSVTIADDSHNHTIANVDGLQTALDGKLASGANAVSASTLATARSIALGGDVSGSANFDGSANITITATIADDSHNHVVGNIDGIEEYIQDVAGAMVSTNTESGIAVTYNDTTGKLDFDVNDPTITLTGAVTGSATMTNLGNVSIATTATADPTLTITGDASGSATFTNLGNASLTLTIADDSHNHTIANVDGLSTALSSAESGAVATANAYTDGRETAITTAYQTYADQAEVDAKSYADTQIANLVDSSPAALDTLNELAAALGDDPNFATTVSTQIGTKLDASHDMTLTLSGDASGSATFTNMGNATLSVVVADDSHNHVVGNIDGIAEYIQDISGAMWATNSEAGVSVVYQDTDGTLDINVNDPTITLTGAVTGSATMTNLGNVSIATTATADPTLTINGDASGSATFTNLGNATLTLTIADDSHNHTIANVDGLQAELDGKLTAGATSGNGISGSASSGTFTVTSNATNANTANTIVYRDASGNFSANVITATSTSARYADLAENYTADAEYAPGTVVSFGGDAEVTVNGVDMDRKVAGVVSTDPAHLMNADCAGNHVVALALQGRVPCKVVGAVAKGDMMVAAGNGFARAEADPKIGSIIGKALEAHTGDEGVIEVAVGRF